MGPKKTPIPCNKELTKDDPRVRVNAQAWRQSGKMVQVAGGFLVTKGNNTQMDLFPSPAP